LFSLTVPSLLVPFHAFACFQPRTRNHGSHILELCMVLVLVLLLCGC
jgi:hypothetical protein